MLYGFKTIMMQAFSFDRTTETFHRRIVPTMSKAQEITADISSLENPGIIDQLKQMAV